MCLVWCVSLINIFHLKNDFYIPAISLWRGTNKLKQVLNDENEQIIKYETKSGV